MVSCQGLGSWQEGRHMLCGVLAAGGGLAGGKTYAVWCLALVGGGAGGKICWRRAVAGAGVAGAGLGGGRPVLGLT